MWKVARQFVSHVLPGIVRPLRVLWNEVIGFVFLVLALLPIPRMVRAWKDFNETGEGLFQMMLAACFSVLMGFFGVTSFLRARRISRS